MIHIPLKQLLFVFCCFLCFNSIAQNISDVLYLKKGSNPKKMEVKTIYFDKSDTTIIQKKIFYSTNQVVDSMIRLNDNRITEKYSYKRDTHSYLLTYKIYDLKTQKLKHTRKNYFKNDLIAYTEIIDQQPQNHTTIKFNRDTFSNISKIEVYKENKKVNLGCIHNHYDKGHMKNKANLVRLMEAKHLRPESVYGAYVSLTGVPEEKDSIGCSSFDTVNIWVNNDTLFKKEIKSKLLSYIYKIYQNDSVEYFSSEYYANEQIIARTIDVLKADSVMEIVHTFIDGEIYKLIEYIHTMDGVSKTIKNIGEDQNVVEEQTKYDYDYDYDSQGNWIIRLKYDDNKLIEKTERSISYFD